jgi:HSP20 family protein
MLYRSMFPQDLFSEMERLQRDLQRAFEGGPSIRGLARGGFPALNVGNTAQSVELYAFAPGLDPGSIEINLERGVLSIAGEREADLPKEDDGATVHISERFAGRFRRVVSLPDDVDPDGVSADYHDGVLHINVKRRQAAQAKRIAIQ